MRIASTTAQSKIGSADILFQCDDCGLPLVVDATAAGMTLKCERCGKPTTVPCAGTPGSAPLRPEGEKRSELQRHLKENESQRTEINGYINQLSIQLHRWQLRLQTLNERNQQLADELAELKSADPPQTTG